jgi:hypothetical protein
MKSIIYCCICVKEITDMDNLIPSICYRKYMDKSHRICYECWFRPGSGFALENISHKCPGCANKFPFTKISYNETEIIDLTNNSE